MYVYWWLEALAIVAVDVFILISGYFLVKSNFKAKNVFEVAINGVWIYSVFFTFIAIKIDTQEISWNTLFKANIDKKILVCKFICFNVYSEPIY